MSFEIDQIALAAMEDDDADKLQVPKEFHVGERDRAYNNDWITAFWREYFQNSTDAGAKTISITIGSGVPKGFHNNDPSAKEITRVIFEDDGTGMSMDVVHNVYFSAGASTKRGQDVVGGFGRARILQAFSQVRYSIRTQDLLVEGDGSYYKAYPVEEATRRLALWARNQRIRAADAPTVEERAFLEAAADARSADAAALAAGPRYVKGCRFEVDLDPLHGDRASRRPTISMLEEKLEEYLAECDLRCRVVVNGVERVRPARKREARRDILATLEPGEIPDAWKDNPRIRLLDRPDGRKDVAFGKILVSEEKGDDLVVRVGGTSMFKRKIYGSPKNLVIELEPAISREVLTSNRDGLKEAYQRAVDHFQKMMSTDARAALEKKEEKQFTVLSGGRGRRVARRAEMDFSGSFQVSASTSAEGAEAEASAPKAPAKRDWVSYQRWQFDEFLKDGIGGVPRADFAAFFDALKASASVEATFLGRWRDGTQASNFLTTLQRNGEGAALEIADGAMLAFLCNELRDRRFQADLDESRRHADKLSDLHDVPILKEHLRPDAERLGVEKAKERRTKLLSAIGRADPRNWDPASGKGMKPRKILAMWQVAVDACVELLMETQPRQKPFPYAAGFCFSHASWQYQPHTGEDGWVNALAKYMQPDSADETRYFLLNPLKDEDFSLAFNPSQPNDRAEMISLAMHEVAHVVAPDSHNERFAGALTFMLGKMTPAWMRQVNRSMDAAVSAVDVVFAGARTRIQPLDDEPGPRPGDVLMTCLPRDIEAAATLRGPDGTSELDCGRLDMLESAVVGPEPQIHEAAYAPSPAP